MSRQQSEGSSGQKRNVTSWILVSSPTCALAAGFWFPTRLDYIETCLDLSQLQLMAGIRENNCLLLFGTALNPIKEITHYRNSRWSTCVSCTYSTLCERSFFFLILCAVWKKHFLSISAFLDHALSSIILPIACQPGRASDILNVGLCVQDTNSPSPTSGQAAKNSKPQNQCLARSNSTTAVTSLRPQS